MECVNNGDFVLLLSPTVKCVQPQAEYAGYANLCAFRLSTDVMAKSESFNQKTEKKIKIKEPHTEKK